MSEPVLVRRRRMIVAGRHSAQVEGMVELRIDVERIIRELGHDALSGKTGKATRMRGLIVCRATDVTER